MTSSLRVLAVFSAAVVTAVSHLDAQNRDGGTAALVVSIYRDSLGHEASAAQIFLPQLGLRYNTNYRGELRIDGLPAGRLALEVRHVGFAPFADTIDVVGARVTTREVVLSPLPVGLDSVRVSARGGNSVLSPGLRQFEERRRQGFGHFLTAGELRSNEDRALTDVIRSKIPGIRRVIDSGADYLASARAPTAGQYGVLGRPPKGSKNTECWLTIYLDGALIYRPTSDPDQPAPPDFNQFRTTEFAGVEYYAGGATLPPQFNATSASPCGALLLWTRER